MLPHPCLGFSNAWLAGIVLIIQGGFVLGEAEPWFPLNPNSHSGTLWAIWDWCVPGIRVKTALPWFAVPYWITQVTNTTMLKSRVVFLKKQLPGTWMWSQEINLTFSPCSKSQTLLSHHLPLHSKSSQPIFTPKIWECHFKTLWQYSWAKPVASADLPLSKNSGAWGHEALCGLSSTGWPSLVTIPVREV